MSQTDIGCGTASYTFTDRGLSGVAPPAQPFTIGFAGVSPATRKLPQNGGNVRVADNPTGTCETGPIRTRNVHWSVTNKRDWSFGWSRE